ncbi:hypothetical protein DRW41_16680 [Neobacillus piezotolerans]|uniref:Uncharacterized protein n=1 Tax=Neobacillus piezotolerans TaxID=2259171 RepID=A0A3D8GN80_9BACI|nr:hypothetical protein DRW41_16680 [Neobacillus piezotolerans]
MLIFSAVLLGFGFIVDYFYKKKGITDLEPERNAANVNGMERAYVESHMNHIRDESRSHGI